MDGKTLKGSPALPDDPPAVFHNGVYGIIVAVLVVMKQAHTHIIPWV